MKIHSNEKLIKRNSRIGNITSLLSIAILGVGMYFSFKDPEGKFIALTFTCLIVGFMLFQIGNYYMNRFGKPPRPDQKITQSLKGLDDKYSLYHYMTSVSHLLVGPTEIYCLLPYNQVGSITFDQSKNRWKQSGGNFFMKTFGGDNLGRPDLDSNYAVSDLVKFFEKKGVKLGLVTPEPVIVFTNEKAVVNPEGYTGLAVTTEKIKEFIRKRAKNNPIAPDLLSAIHQAIDPR